jgi:hypothetical protein
MEIVYFTLGVVAVLLVIGVAIMIRMGILVRTLQEDLRDHERGTHDVTVDLHRRIDDVNDTTYQKIDYEVRELQSRIDSQSKKKK